MSGQLRIGGMRVCTGLVTALIAMLMLTEICEGAGLEISRDLGFGSMGTVLIEPGLTETPRLVIDKGGKILFSDSSEVTRFKSSGSVDPAFGIGGTTSVRGLSGVTSGAPGEIEVDSDGDVFYAFSSFGRISNRTGWEVHKYSPLGEGVGEFGIKGVIGVPPGYRIQSSATGMAPRSDGKLYVSGGRSLSSPNSTARLTLYNADGTVDRHFARNGAFWMPARPKARGSLAGTFTEFTDVKALADDSALVVGTVGRDVVAMRIRPSGTRAKNFGGRDRMVSLITGGTCCQVNGDRGASTRKLVRSRNGRRLFLLVTSARGVDKVLAFSPRGDRIKSFGRNGVATLRNSRRNGFFATSSVTLIGGRLLVSGYMQRQRPEKRFPVLALLNRRGSLVPSFGSNGYLRNFAPGIGRVTDSRLDHQGRLVLAGDNDRRAMKSFSSKLTLSRFLLR